jgi:tetratricopeptide (TPR) repeat protein
VAALGGFLTGCASSRPDADSPSKPAAARSPGGWGVGDAEERRLAAAYAHFGTGVIHEMNEEPEAALEEYYQAALGDIDNEGLVLDVSRRLLQSKQSEKALDLVSRAAARPKASGLLHARLGLIYSTNGKVDQAISACRTAIQKSPDALPGYQTLFVTLLQNRRQPEALQVLDEAAARTGADADFLVGLAGLYVSYASQVPAQKAPATARGLALLERADKLQPSSPALKVAMADCYNLLGDSARASRLYLDLLKKLPDVPMLREPLHAKLAEIYARTQDRTNLLAQLKEIAREDSTNPQIHYFLGSIAFENKQYADAADHLRNAILLKPDLEQAYYDLATTQINLAKPDEALDTLNEARKRFSENFVLEFLSGMVRSRQKNYAEALKHYTAAEVIARATEPKRLNQHFYFQLGATYERKGDYAEAEQQFEKCLELGPDFAEAMNYLGYMWAERGIKLDRARELIEKALRAEPENAAFLDSMGWVLFKQNQPREALEYLLKALQHTEEPDPTLYDHLGDIYAALHDLPKAREAWRKSLDIEPNDQVRRKLDAPRGAAAEQ